MLSRLSEESLTKKSLKTKSSFISFLSIYFYSGTGVKMMNNMYKVGLAAFLIYCGSASDQELYERAVSKNDASDCASIEAVDLYNDCFRTVAIASTNALLCTELESDDPCALRGCEEQVALNATDPDRCEGFSSGVLEEVCIRTASGETPLYGSSCSEEN